MDKIVLQSHLDFLPKPLAEELSEIGFLKTFPAGTFILNEGSEVKFLPILINGLIKVFSSFKDRELLLYYIEPKQSCIMSYAAGIKNMPSNVFAVTEEDTAMVLVPMEQVERLAKEMPSLTELIFDLYNLRYTDLLETINHLLFNKLDERLVAYLKEKLRLAETEVIKISHKQIANELGTVREVVSRLIKKLEADGTILISEEGYSLPN